MLTGTRNALGLTDREVGQCLQIWAILTDSEQFAVPLDAEGYQWLFLKEEERKKERQAAP